MDSEDAAENVDFDSVAKTTLRLDEGLRADAERCARARGIPLAEFIRQAVAHYVAWTAAQEEAQNDQEAPP